MNPINLHTELRGLTRLQSSVAGTEDAVQEAYLAGLEQGREPSVPWARTVAWRHLRGQHRTAVSHRRWCPPHDVVPYSLEARLDARRALARLAELVPAAARRFGGRSPVEFEAALRLRLTGRGDTEVAATTGLRREAINRAMQWLRAHALPPTA